jgi:hypothetical protein
MSEDCATEDRIIDGESPNGEKLNGKKPKVDYPNGE